MMNVMIAGAGKIGATIAHLLHQTQDYQVCVVDQEWSGPDWLHLKERFPQLQSEHLNVQDEAALENFLKRTRFDLMISCLPYFLNLNLAKAALKARIHYFDITEDVAVTQAIQSLAQGASTLFVPQCGLAPGIINIIAEDCVTKFDQPSVLKLRVGALPQQSTHALHYSLTWSTDGLINEYGNACELIEAGQKTTVQALEGLEALEFDGSIYEAFHTSGGLGSLPELYEGVLTHLDYKTIRYPGHRDKMYFLMHDLGLNQNRPLLKQLLEQSIPRTYQDVVLVYVEAHGMIQGQFYEHHYFRKFYPCLLHGMQSSAIQSTTASAVCAVVDYLMHHIESYQGRVYQEQIPFALIQNNRFGKIFA